MLEYKYPLSRRSVCNYEGRHLQKHDGYESTIKRVFLTGLDQCDKCSFRHYKEKIIILNLIPFPQVP